MIYFATVLSLAATGAVAQTLTGQYSCATAGNYQLCQNLWGESAGTGSQTSTLISTSGNSISWETVWNWQNAPNSVKSYANVLSNTAKGVQLSHIASAPTSWSWTYKTESSGIRADVSYDLWLGTASSGTAATKASSYEIMIWLSGQGGIQPVGSQITTGISLAGHNWNLWSGPNSNWQVLSFVSQDGDITNFNADLNEFFQYIIAHNGVSSSQYVQAIQTGTEPFTGNADLLTNSYSVAINQGTPPTSTTSSASSSTTSSTSGTVPKYGQCGGTGYTGSTTCAPPATCSAVSPPYYYQCL